MAEGNKHLSEKEPEFAELFSKIPPEAWAAQDIPTLRVRASAGKLTIPEVLAETITGVSLSEVHIPRRDGTKLSALLYKPTGGAKPDGPLLVWYHSGGWCLPGVTNDHEYFSTICPKYGLTILTPDYRLAPENPFPAGHEDAEDTLRWAHAHTSDLGVDLKRGFLIGGSSAGANFAAYLSHLSVDEGMSPPITGVWLNVPPLIDPNNVPSELEKWLLSVDQNRDAIPLNAESMGVFMGALKPDTKSLLMSPLLWPGGHNKQPPTYLQVCGWDALRDEGLLYAKTLKENGVETRLDVYPGLPHCFWLYFPQLQASQRFAHDLDAGVDWLLQHTQTLP